MKKEKLTDWFDPSIKPTINGVYDVREFEGDPGTGAQYWNGRHWCFYGLNREDAAQCAHRGKSMFQNHQWRGLAEDPALTKEKK